MAASTLAGAETPVNLMPMPAQVAPGAGRLVIDSTFRAATHGYSDARLEAAMIRFGVRLARQTGIPMSGESHPALVVECREGGNAYPSLNENESYQLDISADGARLKAQTVTGALRGLETFLQLIGPGRDGFQAPAMHIEDQPRFPWRGIMMDVSRHWMPLPVIERNLDAMAAVKMNVLHWHLADDQGFRVESKRFPRLHQLGSDGNYYTQTQVRHIIDYARDRGIRVIPEFDIPGHTTSWFAGYPELASAPGPYAIERTWGIFQPTMDPTREEIYTFLDGFIGEMAALFPDPYFHIGGDEVDDTQWKQSPTIQSFARAHGLATSRDLHAYFNQRVQALVKKHGKIMIGWDEVLNPGLAPDTVIQSWRGQDSLADAARKGYRGILSFGYYLDHLEPTSFHYGIDPQDGEAGKLDADQTARILGGETCMWSEYVSPETVDSRIWPKAAAIAERLWSPRQVKDVASMYARMEAVSRVLDQAGAQHRANYARMLDRLAGGRPAEPVRILADAVEALGIEGRRDARKYTSQVPLNRLVDAARPESESVRRMEQAVVRFQPADLADLRATLTGWTENHMLLAALSQNDFLLSELMPLSECLSSLGSIGLGALDHLQSGHPAPATWIAEQRQRLDEMQKLKSEVALAALRPVRLLVDAASKGSTASARN
jgi:hexosaminidase